MSADGTSHSREKYKQPLLQYVTVVSNMKVIYINLIFSCNRIMLIVI